MGDVISLDQRRRARASSSEVPAHLPGILESVSRPSTTLFFDLASPATYLAAERADRLFPGLVWCPVLTGQDGTDAPGWAAHLGRGSAEARAAELGMPLVWPEGRPAAGRAAMRMAAFAAETGYGAAFVLAASRLAFCGGFGLDDPEVLAEAAMAAGMSLEEGVRAAGDSSRDAAMEAAGHSLLEWGADALPVLRVGHRLFCGENRLDPAAASFRNECARRRPVPLDESAG